MLYMGYMKLLFVFLLITFLTLTAARRHGQHSQFDVSLDSGEYAIDQRPGNGHKNNRNHRGRGGGHQQQQGVMRGNVGFNVGMPDSYPLRGPVQQPFIPAPSNGRGQGPHRFAEPQISFQQQAGNNLQFPSNNLQQSSNNFPQQQRPPNQQQAKNFPQNTNNYQGPPTQGNNFQQLPSNNFPQKTNNYQGPPTQGNNFQQLPANNFPQNTNNYQGPPTQGNNFQQLPANNFPQTTNIYQGPPIQANPANNNGLIQQPSFNPFLPQTTAQANKQNLNSFEPVTNELPTTAEPSNTTPYYTNPRRTDLLYGSNLLEEDQKLEGKSTTTEFSLIDRGLFDTAPHCQPDYILVNNKCRLKV